MSFRLHLRYSLTPVARVWSLCFILNLNKQDFSNSVLKQMKNLKRLFTARLEGFVAFKLASSLNGIISRHKSLIKQNSQELPYREQYCVSFKINYAELFRMSRFYSLVHISEIQIAKQGRYDFIHHLSINTEFIIQYLLYNIYITHN